MWKVTLTSISRYEQKYDTNGIEGNRRASDSISSPTWADVRKYIELLDGRICDEMDLEGPGRCGMAIGGGPDRFTISVIGDEMGPYALLGPELTDEPTTIVYGGVKTTDLPRRYIVTREQTLQAAEYFFHHGQIDPELNWQLC